MTDYKFHFADGTILSARMANDEIACRFVTPDLMSIRTTKERIVWLDNRTDRIQQVQHALDPAA